MIDQVLEELNSWIHTQNEQAEDIGAVRITKTEIHIIGQTALLEAGLSIEVVATTDVDLRFQIEYRVKKKLDELLRAHGKHLDPVGHEAWMPEETQFRTVYSGDIVSGYIAEPVYIMVSKAKKAPDKNRQLITDYLASRDLDQKFFELCEKYEVDLGKFV